MPVIKFSSLIDREVERLFNELHARYGDYCENPVTGGAYVHGKDPIAPQKKEARRALLAREYFALYGPADLQPLPLSDHELYDWRYGPGLLSYYFHYFARSLANQRFDFKEHPSVADYISGLLWEEVASCNGDISAHPDYRELVKLQKRFRPRKLAGLASFDRCWYPPKLHAKRMAKYQQRLLREALIASRLDNTPIDKSTIPESVLRAAAEAESFYKPPVSQAQSQPEN